MSVWPDIAPIRWTARVTTYGKAAAYVLGAIALATAIGFGVGLYVGNDWQKGRTALNDNATLRADIAAALTALRGAQGAAAQISRDATAASTTLNGVSKGLSDDLESNRGKATVLGAALEQAIARNPAGTAARADADFMRAWNAANAGDPAGAAGAGEPGAAGGRGPDRTMPGKPASGAGQQPGGAGAQSPAGRRHLLRLPDAPGAAGGSSASARGAGAAADRTCTWRAGTVMARG